MWIDATFRTPAVLHCRRQEALYLHAESGKSCAIHLLSLSATSRQYRIDSIFQSGKCERSVLGIVRSRGNIRGAVLLFIPYLWISFIHFRISIIHFRISLIEYWISLNNLGYR